MTHPSKQLVPTDSGGVKNPILTVDGLAVQFATEHGWQTVVDQISYTLGRGEVLGLVGESGSGKSVSSLAIMGLVGQGSRITNGSVRLDGRELVGLGERELEAVRGDRIAMVFQEPMTSLNPAFTVGNQIREVLRRHRGLSKAEAHKRAIEALDRVGIPNAAGRVDAYPFELSGGMRQRAMIAMAIVCGPAVLIADEPTTALDVTIQAQILDLLRDMIAELDMGLLFITHNMGVVANICDRVAVMYAGQLVEQATVSDLFLSPQHPYTEGLLRATPQLGGRRGRLPSIPGSTPQPWDFARGCRFQDRCPYAAEACAEPVPLMATPSGGLSRCARLGELNLKGVR